MLLVLKNKDEEICFTGPFLFNIKFSKNGKKMFGGFFGWFFFGFAAQESSVY